MKKTLLITAALLAAITCDAQLTLSDTQHTLRQRRLMRKEGTSVKYFTGTNEFGRTYAEQCAHELDTIQRKKFSECHPSGRDLFGRTYDEYTRFANDFDLDEFFGVKFGTHLEAESERKLAKPFRMLTDMTLTPTDMQRLGTITLGCETINLSLEDLEAETVKIALLLECAYGILFDSQPFVHLPFDKQHSYVFNNSHIKIKVQYDYEVKTGQGGIVVKVEKTGMIDADLREKLNAVKKKQVKTCLPITEDIEQLPLSTSKEKSATLKALSSALAKDPTASLYDLRRRAENAMQKSK